MSDDFKASRPIYMQIVDKIMQQIARQELKEGQKLPSVREMAIESGVNPNTIQRTYSELERMHIVETKRGQGTFITDKREVLEEVKKKLQFDIVDRFIANMKELGMSEEELIAELTQHLNRRKEGKS
ncbi:GntR family transcriptional regulator [Niallia taxi]|uniref:GntR family transcriptional regulator n=1 Tax=Niallia taxi TaxID=2499688 RepID=A0A3S2UGM8_9BACI|nr:GntR family transcriptional regulator [Niallia taxi]MCM3215253.1 GntR family transcriptional regulator [Niallia taxi]MDK8639554.1 GntR family transcriptional regulator [Niallia taxi]MED4037928.1 GntR family transcriptional regulator [Niallia taxi]MED4055860.1 GntR family transcriptional regulator [Niallia taxi]MED4117856.1 GntR family transcriptional regulator [Niallia taxi]